MTTLFAVFRRLRSHVIHAHLTSPRDAIPARPAYQRTSSARRIVCNGLHDATALPTRMGDERVAVYEEVAGRCGDRSVGVSRRVGDRRDARGGGSDDRA